jgi:hypothetical protein
VLEASRLSEEELGGFLRREGLQEAVLAAWKATRRSMRSNRSGSPAETRGGYASWRSNSVGVSLELAGEGRRLEAQGSQLGARPRKFQEVSHRWLSIAARLRARSGGEGGAPPLGAPPRAPPRRNGWVARITPVHVISATWHAQERPETPFSGFAKVDVENSNLFFPAAPLLGLRCSGHWQIGAIVTSSMTRFRSSSPT